MATQGNSPVTLDRLLLDSGLNEDCFIPICKHLNISDLINICSLDTVENNTFMPFIQKNVMNGVLFDFEEFQSQQRAWSISDVFKQFGRSMKKLKVVITPASFSPFMRNVIRYCRPNWLTEIEILIKIDQLHKSRVQFDDEIFLEARPFFQRLEKLTINCKGIPNLFYKENLFLWHSPHLKSLTLERCNLAIDWPQLIPVGLSGISELRLFNVSLNARFDYPDDDGSLNGLRSLLDRLPHLEVFVNVNCGNYRPLKIEAVAKELVRRYPNLRGFGYTINDFNDNEQNIDHFHLHSFLTRFTNLTEFHLSKSPNYNYPDARNILALVPKIEIFGIHQIRFKHSLVEVRRMVRSIQGIVEGRRKTAGNLTGGKNFIRLEMNELQYNDFQAINPTQRMAVVGSKCNCCSETYK